MIWLIRNWQLALLMAVAFLAAALGIRSSWLSTRLERAQKRVEDLESYRNGRTQADEVDQRIGGDPAAARKYLRNRKP